MPEPPRRKRFQIHLSTAIVMMFVAGGLMWTNVAEKTYNHRYDDGHAPQPFIVTWKNSGFPMRYSRPVDASEAPVEFAEYIKVKSAIIAAPSMIGNALFAIFILWVVWFLCEWLIRRRAARA